jgi:hypothetical protein
MFIAGIAHHVPHTTVPANRPHRPVSAPPERSPRAETGQPVRTPHGGRGRRPARRLHPCARPSGLRMTQANLSEHIQIAGFSWRRVRTRRAAPDPGREGAWLQLVNPDREKTGRACITGRAALPASFAPLKRKPSRSQGHVRVLRRSDANRQTGGLPNGQTGKRASGLTTARAGNQAVRIQKARLPAPLKGGRPKCGCSPRAPSTMQTGRHATRHQRQEASNHHIRVPDRATNPAVRRLLAEVPMETRRLARAATTGRVCDLTSLQPCV